jgi:hypothetical protein
MYGESGVSAASTASLAFRLFFFFFSFFFSEPLARFGELSVLEIGGGLLRSAVT